MSGFRAEDIGMYRRRLLRFAQRRLRDPAQAEDAVQETLIAAVENPHRFSGASSLGTWLTGILKHKIVDCMRHEARNPRQEFDDDDAAAHAAVQPRGDPELALMAHCFLDRLEQCVQALPQQAARVFVLRDVMGLNIAETCRELAISSSNCSVMLHRARLRLRAQLSAAGYGARGAC